MQVTYFTNINNGIISILSHFDHFLDECDCKNERNDGLSTAEAVATAAVVSGVCCFTAGLLLATWVYLFRCRRRIDKANDVESQTLRLVNHPNTNDEINKDPPNTNDDSKANANESNKDLSNTNEK